MTKKKGKPVSFDAMVKFFMQSYGIPTKKDIDKLMARLDRLEELIKVAAISGNYGHLRNKTLKNRNASSAGVKNASDLVWEIIRATGTGIGFDDIQRQVGYNDKKLRNIIFRLNKAGRIRRIRRGIYIAIS